MVSFLQSLPAYQQLLVVLLVCSGLSCVFCPLYGILYRWGNENALPPAPPFYAGSTFPRPWAQILAWAYFAFYAMSAFQEATSADPSPMELDSTLSIVALLVGLVFQYGFSIPLVIVLITLPNGNRPKHAFLKAMVSIPLAMTVLMASLHIMEASGFIEWLVGLTHCPEVQGVVESFDKSGLAGEIILGFTACVLAPIAEECFFRGFLYTTLRHWSGPVAAALCSSLFFAGIHAALVQFLPLFLFALVQCFLYERFRTLWVPIAFHSVYNFLNLVLVLIYGLS